MDEVFFSLTGGWSFFLQKQRFLKLLRLVIFSPQQRVKFVFQKNFHAPPPHIKWCATYKIMSSLSLHNGFSKVPEICEDGYYGINCTRKCLNCNCDPATGCLNQSCNVGFWGPECQSECHCLNGVTCDKQTGRCDPDATTGLRICEIGFMSDTDVALDNCQKCNLILFLVFHKFVCTLIIIMNWFLSILYAAIFCYNIL